MWLLRVIYESILIAYHQLVSNKMRSFLSILGIGIGIFCIISVLSAVDSLKFQVEDGFSSLGSDVIYVSKQSWSEPPRQNAWKYARRPNPDYIDFTALEEALPDHYIAISKAASAGTIKYKNNSTSRGFIMTVSPDYDEVYALDIEEGRYFTELEHEKGSNVAILGYKVSEALFGEFSPLGKEINLKGQKYQVVGKFEEQGEALFSAIPYDIMTMVPYQSGKKIINYNADFFEDFLTIKGNDSRTTEDLKNEIAVTVRSARKLRPAEENNFDLNELSVLSKILDSVFSVLNMAGIIIGGFAILVGMFSVANIMFVSVQERINIIGVKKAIGAKRYVILLEYLIEAIVLCILGGVAGLIFVFLSMKAITHFANFPMFLSLENTIYGVVISVVIGILSGIIPAYRAASLDPVEAMR